MFTDKIEQLKNGFNLNDETAKLCIDPMGNIDVEKLAVAVKSNKPVKEDPEKEKKAKIEKYVKSYNDAKARRDAPAMFSLKSRIYELGGVV